MRKQKKPQPTKNSANDHDKTLPVLTDKPAKKRLSRKQKILLISLFGTLSLLVVTIALWFFVLRPKPVYRPATTSAVKDEKPVLVPSPLTGVGVSAEEAKQPVVSVVIENLYPDARPQSGLATAGVVYEALAEGGITRYQAFFQKIPTDIGPVRSLRTYFATWAAEYNAPVVHAGGNVDALDLIPALKIKDLDQFANGKYFRRISGRFSPHNLYIYGEKLTQLISDKKYNSLPSFSPWPRKDDSKSAAPTASSITLNYSTYDYQAKFSFNATTNNYTRYLRGAEAIDANGKVTIKPKVVIVMVVPTSFGYSRNGAKSVAMQLTGSGKAYIFQDGNQTVATWKKASATARTEFFDTVSAKPIALNRGQTWVSVIPSTDRMSVQ